MAAVAGVLVVAAAIVLVVQWRESARRDAQFDDALGRARTLAADPDRLSDARLALDEALKLDPDRIDGLMLRGETLFQLSLYPEAQADLERAVRLARDEERARAQILLGRILHARYRGAQSDEHFRAATTAFFEAQGFPSTRPAALEGFAMLLLVKGRNFDLERGLEFLRRLVADHPDSEEAGYARGLIEQLGRAPEGG